MKLVRDNERRSVLFPLRWHHPGCGDEPALARDFSSGGVFLTPVGAGARAVHSGDPIWLGVDEESEPLSGTIRWHGWSNTHKRAGFGIEFDERSKSAAEHLQERLRRVRF